VGARDPWEQALDRHIAGAGGGDGGRPAGAWRRRLPWVVAAVCAVALVAVAVVAVLAVGENRDRADGWRERSEVLQDLVADRTRALNRQTARLNVAATRLRQARSAIARSEADVRTLEERQRELADEKARVEDDRLLLEGAAELLDRCRTGLQESLDALAAGLEPDPALTESTAAACAEADARLGG
jgi:septal ring factor EnvC (AmiA/AmiB activator)